MSVLFYIGIALFVIGIIGRLYYAFKWRGKMQSLSDDTALGTVKETYSPYRKKYLVWAIIGIIGLTLSIFAI